MLREEKNTLKHIAQGNQEVFDELFRFHYKYLVTIAYSYTKDFELSKDLAQEVFFDIWRRRTNIVINSSLKSFLKKAVINQAITAIKKKKHTTLPETANEIQEHSSVENEIEFQELKIKIQSIIDGMPEKCKQIFVLSRFKNLSHKEISIQLGISTKTIESHITKAIKTLKNELKQGQFLTMLFYLIHSSF